MSGIFLGRPIFWVIWALLIPILLALGLLRMHVVDFNVFLAILVGATTVCILFVVVTYRQGEAITREPFLEPSIPAE